MYLENETMIKTAYSELHTQTSFNFVGQNIEERAEQFLDILNKNKDKAIFAQHLANKIEEDYEYRSNFRLHEHIEKAIKWVIQENEHNSN